MNLEWIETQDFPALILGDIPLIDVRSESEFSKGSMPYAVNLPILTTSERAKVGTCYIKQGSEAAIKLGHSLVSGKTKERRTQSWHDFAVTNPHGALFCWRGGMRSQIACEWLHESGIAYPRVRGGFKNLRRFFLETIEDLGSQLPFIVLGGRTGSGKTRLLQTLDRKLDLENLANHRGSAFGRNLNDQPSPIDFENSLATCLLKLSHNVLGRIAVEDEGPNIGSLSIPQNLYANMSASPLVVLEENLATRVENILQEYVIERLEKYQKHFDAENAWNEFSESFLGAVRRISKRLGGDRTTITLELMQGALNLQHESGETSRHRDWISYLLREYYDPLYDSQMARKNGKALLCGDAGVVRGFIIEQSRMMAC